MNGSTAPSIFVRHRRLSAPAGFLELQFRHGAQARPIQKGATVYPVQIIAGNPFSVVAFIINTITSKLQAYTAGVNVTATPEV